jgi:hypothetical protein
MVKTRTKMPDLTASDNAMLLSGVKLRLAGVEKAERAATKQELAQRQETLKAQTLTQPEDQMAMFKASQADVDEQARNAEPNFDYLDPMFEKALEGQTVIAVDPSVKPIARGPQVRERIDALIAEADKADQDYRTARYAMPAQGKRGAPERAAAMEALTKGKTALENIRFHPNNSLHRLYSSCPTSLIAIARHIRFCSQLQALLDAGFKRRKQSRVDGSKTVGESLARLRRLNRRSSRGWGGGFAFSFRVNRGSRRRGIRKNRRPHCGFFSGYAFKIGFEFVDG